MLTMPVCGTDADWPRDDSLAAFEELYDQALDRLTYERTARVVVSGLARSLDAGRHSNLVLMTSSIEVPRLSPSELS